MKMNIYQILTYLEFNNKESGNKGMTRKEILKHVQEHRARKS